MNTKTGIFETLIPNDEGIYDVTCDELKTLFPQCHVLDVRRPDEWVSDLGHIEGVEFATLETDFMKFIDSVPEAQKSDTWVFVCRSGARSARAAAIAQQKGFQSAFNMQGGMIRWNSKGYPVSQNPPT